jgi:hypothetical protein
MYVCMYVKCLINAFGLEGVQTVDALKLTGYSMPLPLLIILTTDYAIASC